MAMCPILGGRVTRRAAELTTTAEALRKEREVIETELANMRAAIETVANMEPKLLAALLARKEEILAILKC